MLRKQFFCAAFIDWLNSATENVALPVGLACAAATLAMDQPGSGCFQSLRQASSDLFIDHMVRCLVVACLRPGLGPDVDEYFEVELDVQGTQRLKLAPPISSRCPEGRQRWAGRQRHVCRKLSSDSKVQQVQFHI